MNVQISPCAFRCKKAKRIKCLNLQNKCLDPYCKYQPFNLKQNMCTVIMSRVLSLCSKVIGHIYIRSSSVKIFNILFSESLQPSSALTYEGFFLPLVWFSSGDWVGPWRIFHLFTMKSCFVVFLPNNLLNDEMSGEFGWIGAQRILLFLPLLYQTISCLSFFLSLRSTSAVHHSINLLRFIKPHVHLHLESLTDHKEVFLHHGNYCSVYPTDLCFFVHQVCNFLTTSDFIYFKPHYYFLHSHGHICASY